MLLLNFAHPLTAAHQAQIEAISGQTIVELREVRLYFDHERPFAAQVVELVDSVGLSPAEWQTAPLLINPPSHSLIALTLLAELHGRMGYFPAVLRLKPVAGATPPQFDVAEIINLQALRDTARQLRR